MINYKDLKKKDEVRTTQLDELVSGKLLATARLPLPAFSCILHLTPGH